MLPDEIKRRVITNAIERNFLSYEELLVKIIKDENFGQKRWNRPYTRWERIYLYYFVKPILSRKIRPGRRVEIIQKAAFDLDRSFDGIYQQVESIYKRENYLDA